MYPDADNRQAIEALHLWVKQTYPAAPAAFWLARSWDLLCWQPIYLTLVLARDFQGIDDLQGLWFAAPPQEWGFGLSQPVKLPRIPISCLQRSGPVGPDAALVGWLKESIYLLYSQASQVFGIRASLAQRLAADNLATALLRQYHQSRQGCSPDFDPGPTVNQALQSWLRALDWPGQISLVATPEGDLALRRQSCCLEYRLHGAAKCASCPLLSSPRPSCGQEPSPEPNPRLP